MKLENSSIAKDVVDLKEKVDIWISIRNQHTNVEDDADVSEFFIF